MVEHAAVDGTRFTDEDLDRWAEHTEQGYTGGHLGPSTPGRPVSVGDRARPFTLRLDAVRRAKLDQAARRQGTTASQLVRDLIDAIPADRAAG